MTIKRDTCGRVCNFNTFRDQIGCLPICKYYPVVEVYSFKFVVVRCT